MSKQIFIGGTGRSGTSILYKYLGAHQEIYAFPYEMRFIIDNHGLMNLIDSLTWRYSIVQSREALYQFEVLMSNYLIKPYHAPYVGFNFPKWLGRDFYWKELNKFCESLVDASFVGSSYQVAEYAIFSKLYPMVRPAERIVKKLKSIKRRILNQNIRKQDRPFWPERELKLVKYFSDRRKLCMIASNFVDNIFMRAAVINGKSGWCEKTPSNLLHLDFLWELFPDSYFIHVKRDPRGVVQSMQNQFWAPARLEDACLSLKSHCERWFDLRNQLDLAKHHYYEFKLEDWAQDTKKNVKKFTAFCGLTDDYINPPDITLDKVNYWQKLMKRDDKKIIDTMLGEAIEKMGYKI